MYKSMELGKKTYHFNPDNPFTLLHGVHFFNCRFKKFSPSLAFIFSYLLPCFLFKFFLYKNTQQSRR